ncbi:MAG: fibronectin type III domain-containing protein [Catenulispora sp.]|nr:fibronectin type III domain-containing protein [Catenulispora sp.]
MNDPADTPTMAIQPKGKRGKRIAVVSAAMLAALILAAVAIVESRGNDDPVAKNSSKVGDPLTGAASGGVFPAGDSSTTSTGQTPGTSSSSSSDPATPAAAVNPGNAASPSSGASTPLSGGQNSGGQPTSSQSSHTTAASAPNTAKTTPPVSKTTSKSAPPPGTTTTQPPQPTHNPPISFGHGEIGVNVPGWIGSTPLDVTVSWNAHSDATSYVLHYTVDNGTDQQVTVSGTSYVYKMNSMGSGSTSCIQLRAVNQYGQSAFYPQPMFCFNSNGQTVSGSL